MAHLVWLQVPFSLPPPPQPQVSRGLQAATIYLTKQYEDPNTPGPQQGTVFLWASLVPADLLAVEAAPQRFW